MEILTVKWHKKYIWLKKTVALYVKQQNKETKHIKVSEWSLIQICLIFQYEYIQDMNAARGKSRMPPSNNFLLNSILFVRKWSFLD
jgi:hypothetical protein